MRNAHFESALLKIKRSEQHILNFERGTAAFFSGDFYTLVEEVQPDTGNRIVKIKLRRGLPDDFALIVGDAISNMRSALDHAAMAMAVHTDPKAKGVEFPFAGNFKEFQSLGTQRKMRNLPLKAQAIISGLKPYRGGNDLLWAISRLRNTDVHNLVLPMGCPSRQLSLIGLKICDGTITVGAPPNSLIEGIPIINLGKSGSLSLPSSHANIAVSAQIVFGNVDIVRGSQVGATLKQMHGLILDILRIIDKEFFV